MRRYGIPYKGSKQLIAENIIFELPSGERLVDLFAGGCAITHCGMQSGKWKRFLMVDTMNSPLLFIEALNGRLKNEKRWVSREEFFRTKDTDPYARICFSFSNNGNFYMYRRELEPYKKALHYAVVFDDWNDFKNLMPENCDEMRELLEKTQDIHQRRRVLQKQIVEWLKKHGTTELLMKNPLYKSVKLTPFGTVEQTLKIENLLYFESLESLQGLQNLERLESIQNLERHGSMHILENLECLGSLQKIQSLDGLVEFQQKSYDAYEHKAGDVVYADPPYITAHSKSRQYGNAEEFDKEAFCDWCRTRDFPVYVSEYEMPADFNCIASFECKLGRMKQRKDGVYIKERLWLHKKWKHETEFLLI